MTSQDPRAEVRILQDEIDELNHRKGPLEAAWGKESKGSLYSVLHAAKTSAALKELQAINKRLAFLYGQRNAILKEHPGLQREFGKPTKAEKQFRATDRLETQAARTARDREQRKMLMHPDFKAWCAAQRPQVKASLENWENGDIRQRFQSALVNGRWPGAAEPASSAAGVQAGPSAVPRGPMPHDFIDFLKEMEHARARASMNRQDELWQSDADLRDVYALWREERAKTKTPA